jgi:hypothetical protein
MTAQGTLAASGLDHGTGPGARRCAVSFRSGNSGKNHSPMGNGGLITCNERQPITRGRFVRSAGRAGCYGSTPMGLSAPTSNRSWASCGVIAAASPARSMICEPGGRCRNRASGKVAPPIPAVRGTEIEWARLPEANLPVSIPYRDIMELQTTTAGMGPDTSEAAFQRLAAVNSSVRRPARQVKWIYRCQRQLGTRS